MTKVPKAKTFNSATVSEYKTVLISIVEVAFSFMSLINCIMVFVMSLVY